MVHSEGKSYFLEVIECGAVTKKKILNNMIRMAQDTCKVKAVVTDIANMMQKTRQLLITESDMVLLAYGCSFHWLNLLEQDITSRDILKQMIKNHHLSVAWLLQNSHINY